MQTSDTPPKRPKIPPDLGPIDKAVFVLGALGVVVSIIIPLVHYSSLPDTIPVHFGIGGEPDGYGSKFAIFLLPVVNLVLWGLLIWLHRVPHIFNYPFTITEENARRHYTIGARLVLVMALIVAWSFAGIEWMMVQNAMGNMYGLGQYTVLIWLAVMMALPVVYLVVAAKR